MSAKFQLVEDQVEVAPPAPPPAPKTSAIDWGALQLLGVALTALSQRALVALGQCFTLLTVASAFYLWYLTPEPTDRQIVSLAIYAVFVLVVNVIVRRR
jgi:hypothetical protein